MSSTSNSALAVATSDFGLFLPPNLAPPNASFAVSIVDLCNPRATYAIQCINPVACGHDNPVSKSLCEQSYNLLIMRPNLDLDSHRRHIGISVRNTDNYERLISLCLSKLYNNRRLFSRLRCRLSYLRRWHEDHFGCDKCFYQWERSRCSYVSLQANSSLT